MSSLRELSKELIEVQEMASNPDIPAEAIKDTIDGMEGLFNDKAVSVVHVITNSGSDVDSIDAEIKRLQDRKKVILNGQKSLKEYLRMNMEATGTTKITSPLFSITLAKGREMAVIDNEQEIPDEYTDVKTVISPIKASILKALKEGVDVPGAHIERAQSSVRIK